MASNTSSDAVDQVVNDLRGWQPGLEVVGLPVTGRVLRLAQYVTAAREQRLIEFGLTVPDFDVLATLRRRAGAGSVNVRDLQHAMMLSSGGVTKRLDRLEATQLIERHPDPSDRRGVLIKLSQAGLALIDRAVVAITELENTAIGDVLKSEQERLQLEKSLRRLLSAHEATDS